MAASDFKPALIVVDFQEDFCPPDGSLAVTGGRDIAPVINKLLAMPFAVRVATQDWHPRDHVSFASNHEGPDNKPFESLITVANPLNPSETESVRLWPDHCIQGSPGAELLPELDTSGLDHVVKKGQDSRVEMFSAFRDTYKAPCVSQSALSEVLQKAKVTDVFVVGLAHDFCVKHTAIDAVEDGYRTFVVDEGTKAVFQDTDSLKGLRDELEGKGIRHCSIEGPEIGSVLKLD